MRIALDTNILAYAENVVRVPADAAKVERAIALLDVLLLAAELVVPAQVQLELFFLLTRRVRLSRSEAGMRVTSYRQLVASAATDDRVIADALSLAADHQMQVFDATILAAAASAGCDVLLSEDMAHGFVWRGVEVMNPFDGELGPVMARLRGGRSAPLDTPPPRA